MKHLSRLVFIFIVFSLIFFTSCSKSVEKKIEGKWKRVMVEDVSSTYNEYWEFYPGGQVVIHRDSSLTYAGPKPFNDSCHYVINSGLSRSYIYLYIKQADTLVYNTYNGVWEIIYLKKNTMMIVLRPTSESIDNQGQGQINPNTQGPILSREFVKE